MTLLLDSGKKTMTYSVYTFKDRVAEDHTEQSTQLTKLLGSCSSCTLHRHHLGRVFSIYIYFFLIILYTWTKGSYCKPICLGHGYPT